MINRMDQKEGIINVSVANIYREATYKSEIVTQGLLGERLKIIQPSGDFSIVELPDTYQGWLSNLQWVNASEQRFPTRKIRSKFLRIYDNPSSETCYLREATFGSDLSIVDDQGSWIKVMLPDGLAGWVNGEAFKDFPEMSRQSVVDLAEEFLGCPYFWGGRSSKGFDCSGLTQTIFSALNIMLPRDAWMQHRDGEFVSNSIEKANPGDLYFFSESSRKITHVGIAVGNNKMIHARGFVRVNSLQEGDPDFSNTLFNTFVDTRTFIY